MKRQLAIAVMAACTIGWGSSAWAQQRPLVTEDPETIGAGLILIEGGFDVQHDVFYPVSGLQGNLLRLPTLGVSFGISSIAELQIDGGVFNRLAVTSRQDAPLSSMLDFTGDRTTDVEDIVVGTKIRLMSETAGRPSIGVRLATKLPNASNESGLGLDTTDFYVSGLVGKTVQSIRFVGQLRAGHSRRSHPRRPAERPADVRDVGGARGAAGARSGRGNQRPARHPRRRAASGHRQPRCHADRRSLHERHRPHRWRHHHRHDVARSERRLYRRRDVGLPRIHYSVDQYSDSWISPRAPANPRAARARRFVRRGPKTHLHSHLAPAGFPANSCMR